MAHFLISSCSRSQLARPKVKNLKIDQDTVFRLVDENAKKRFELVYGFDPSPTKPKKKHVQPPKKKRPPPPGYGPKAGASGASTPGSGVESVTAAVAAVSVEPSPLPSPEPEWTELAFVKLPPPESSFDSPEGGGVAEGDDGHTGQWYIRAVQGHSIKLEGTDHLVPVLADEEGRTRAGALVHGTKWELWETLSESAVDEGVLGSEEYGGMELKGSSGGLEWGTDIAENNGLSKMNRQHIHLAPALKDHHIMPRNNSTLLIFLDLPKLLAADIPVYSAANGVVLTPGDKDGVVHKEFWRKAVHVAKGTRTVVWEDGKAADRVEKEGEE